MMDSRIDRAAQALLNHDTERRAGANPPHIVDVLDADAYREVAVKMLSAADDEYFEFPQRRSQRAQLRAV